MADVCPDSETLVSYAIGILDRPRFVVVLKHIANCRNCRIQVLALHDVLEELSEKHKARKEQPKD